jgi:hypothetical protein
MDGHPEHVNWRKDKQDNKEPNKMNKGTYNRTHSENQKDGRPGESDTESPRESKTETWRKQN